MSNYALESVLAREYTKKTGREAYELVQDWRQRQLWYPSMRYVVWLESKLRKAGKAK